MTATDILLAFWLTSALLGAAAVFFAPEGYEDKDGFHYGTDDE
jgi:hypothetical protein